MTNKKRNLLLSTVATLALALSACGGGDDGMVAGGPRMLDPEPVLQPDPDPDPPRFEPASFLSTPRFTTHQPDVLEQIGAHHAYARELTGRGVTIGIDDSIVDYTQTGEFENRVKLRAADGAVLTYLRPLGDNPFSDVSQCRINRTCQVFGANSQGDDEARNRWAQHIVRNQGWPVRDDSLFILDRYYSQFDQVGRFGRWSEVPTPYGPGGSHGTTVASVAAGKNLGVAPGATIVPIANNLSNDQREDNFASQALRQVIASLPISQKRQFDNELARLHRTNYDNFDIINRSYGLPLFDPEVISREIESEFRWYRQHLPNTLRALLQLDTPPAEKTILVYAAGNEGMAFSGIGADLPYYVSDLRGHSLSVVATNPATGNIAHFSNRCGPLPPDWNAARHGPHYCLAAPGIVRGLEPNPNSPGRGSVRDDVPGTSFAAPVVSGALALLMEHFRGTRGNTAIVKRMLDTADRNGPYANLEVYGAGHLDLEAALSPVGSLNVGQSAHALGGTTLQTPAAFGVIARRTDNIELAAFDDQDFPFWIPLSAFIYTPSVGRSPIPQFERLHGVTPTIGLDTLGLQWTALEDVREVSSSDTWTWLAGFGATSAGIARRSSGGDWEYGLSFNDEGYLGAKSTGAFGANIRSGTIWTSRTLKHTLENGWGLDATGTLAISAPHYEKDAIFQASPVALSALAVRIGTAQTGLTVEQPLRAESGTGTFRIENGRIENGQRLYDEYRVGLRPDAREVRLTLRHELDAVGGRVAVEAGGSFNAGHTLGEEETRLGVAYRTAW